MPGNMLEHRQDPAGQQAVSHRPRQQGHLLRGVPISSIANDGIRAGDGHIGDRQAIHIDSDRREIGGDQPGAEIRGLYPLRRAAVVDAAVGGTGRIGRPMRRSEPLDAAAFLVHEHRRFAPDRVANRRRQAAHLCRRLDVALEENDPPRLALAQQRALGGRHRRTRKPGDESAYRHRRGLARACRKGQAQLSCSEPRIGRRRPCRWRRTGSPLGPM